MKEDLSIDIVVDTSSNGKTDVDILSGVDWMQKHNPHFPNWRLGIVSKRLSDHEEVNENV